MSTTEIFNRTKKILKLKVGNNLVFTDLTEVAVDGSYKVHVDLNATYQEYYMGMDRNGKVLIINSDECADSKSITILEDANGTYYAEKELRSSILTHDKPTNSKPNTKFTWKFWGSFGARKTDDRPDDNL